MHVASVLVVLIILQVCCRALSDFNMCVATNVFILEFESLHMAVSLSIGGHLVVLIILQVRCNFMTFGLDYWRESKFFIK